MTFEQFIISFSLVLSAGALTTSCIFLIWHLLTEKKQQRELEYVRRCMVGLEKEIQDVDNAVKDFLGPNQDDWVDEDEEEEQEEEEGEEWKRS